MRILFLTVLAFFSVVRAYVCSVLRFGNFAGGVLQTYSRQTHFSYGAFPSSLAGKRTQRNTNLCGVLCGNGGINSRFAVFWRVI